MRMKTEAKPLWKCGECCEIHDDEDAARECCMPEVYEIYGCPVCDKVHDEEDAALSCCGAGNTIRCPNCSRDYGGGHINHYAVLVASHCNTCNPLYSVEQQLAIEDMHWEYSPGKPQSLLA